MLSSTTRIPFARLLESEEASWTVASSTSTLLLRERKTDSEATAATEATEALGATSAATTTAARTSLSTKTIRTLRRATWVPSRAPSKSFDWVPLLLFSLFVCALGFNRFIMQKSEIRRMEQSSVFEDRLRFEIEQNTTEWRNIKSKFDQLRKSRKMP